VIVRGGGEVWWGRILKIGIWNAFACGATTSSPTGKRRAGIDSAYSKGAETTSLGVLIVDVDGDGGG
jgi:hypothetical protein